MEDDEVAININSCKDHPTVEAEAEEELVLKEEEPKEAAAAAAERRRAERAIRNALLPLAALLAVAVPIVVWRSISHPPELFLWRLSLLLCSCSVIWSRVLDAATSWQTTLLFFASTFTLALCFDAAGDIRMGALIAHLNTHLAAGMLGYALAERRQRDGTEVSAALAAAAATRNRSDEGKAKAEDNLRFYQTLGGIYTAVVTAGFAAPVAWVVVLHRAEYAIEELFVLVFVPLAIVLMFWTLFVGGMLMRGALLQADQAGVLLLVVYFMVAMFLLTMAAVLVGEIAVMILGSVALLGFPGVLGYSLSVYDSFKLRYAGSSNYVADFV